MLFLLTIVFYVSACIAPHKLVLFLFCFIYFFVLWRVTRHFNHAWLVLYITLSPIIVGKLVPIELISERVLNIPGRSFGISSDAIYTISDAIIVCMGIVLVAQAFRRTLSYERHYILEFVLFLYPVSSVIATLVGSVRPEVSMFHMVYTIRPLILYYFIASSAVLPLHQIFSVISAGMLLELFIVVAQILHHGPLGLIIEPIANYVAVDLSRDAVNLARYGGTYMHANALAHALLIPVFVLLPSLFMRSQTKWRVVVISCVAGIATLVLTLSRSAWFAAAVAGGIFVYVAVYRWGSRFYALQRISGWQRGIIVTLVIILGYVMVPRVLSTFASGGQYGSLETRLLLLREYSQTLAIRPYFGVGLEMDIYVQYMRSKVWGDWNVTSPNRSVILYFPEPVHNGLLRLLVQVGIVGTLPFVGIFFILFWMIRERVDAVRTAENRMVLLSLLTLFIAVFINSFMQPIPMDLPLLVTITMLYLRNLT